MRIALLSDIHGNIHALNACLAHAAARGAEGHAFLGDYVGYGADCAAVVDVVMSCAAQGAVALKGNHDAAVETPTSYFNEPAQAALAWARETLDGAQKRFLIALPMVVHEPTTCFVHATALRPERWGYVDSPGAARQCMDAAARAFTFCGHLHDQVLYYETASGRTHRFTPAPGTPIPIHANRRWVAVIGSVGQPRDRNPAAGYTMFDNARRELTFFRVPYDHLSAAARIRACGLPGIPCVSCRVRCLTRSTCRARSGA